MDAVVLAGGLGTRLKGVVSNVPKPMAPVAGRPFLEYLMDYWLSQGVTRFVLSVGYLGHVIKDHFGDDYRGAAVDYAQEDCPLGTGGAVRNALQSVDWHAEAIVLLNGDTWFDVSMERLKQDAARHRMPVTIALKQVHASDRYSAVVIDETMTVRAFNVEQIGTAFINAGCYLLSRAEVSAELNRMPRTFSFEHDFLGPCAHQGKVGASVHEGSFIDIGVPEDYLRAQQIVGGRV